MRWCYVVLSLVCLHHTSAHLCLIEPRQRGPMDISKGGSPTCSRHMAPCGGQESQMPTQSYSPGEKIFFKWQQNLNHYEPGYPGYFDISIARNPNTNDTTTLVVVADKYVHAQDYQENFTAILTAPDMECDHCVIYARYSPHKPTEGSFFQCADIKISKDAKKADDTLKFTRTKTHKERRQMLPLKRAMKLKQTTDLKFNWNTENDDDVKMYGIAYNPFQPQRSHYTSVGAFSGKTEMLMTYNFGVDAPASTTKDDEPKTFMVDEVIAVDNLRNISYLLVHKDGSRDETAKMVYNVGSSNGSIMQMSDIFAFKDGAINGLSWYTDGTSATFRIILDNAGYMFEVGTLDFGGMYSKRATIPTPENLYVNFQWFETQADNYQVVYALMGNENAPDELNARIYAFDVYNGKYLRNVELDVSEYTFMSMHSYPGSGETLYAFSPGLWFSDSNTWAWTLVQIDTNKGTVTKKCDVAPAGVFERFYGGSVFQGAKNTDGFLYHVLRVQGSETDFVVAVNPDTCETRFSESTNLRHIHSLQKLSPQMFDNSKQ